MQIIDNIIILLLLVIAFYVGKKTADTYSRERIADLEYRLQLNAVEKGIGYVPQSVRRAPIGQPFMDRLKANGRATQRLDNSKQSSTDGASAC